MYLQNLKGDELKDHIYFGLVCEDFFACQIPIRVFVNSMVGKYNLRDRDQQRFYTSKWLDLRTNCLKEGWYDVISVTSFYSIKWA